MAIKYLNEKYGGKIDWSKNKTNIIGFDIDDNVRNMALLNIFLEIGELCDKTIVKEDTLHNDMRFEDKTVLDKAKIILANEPMGLKNITFASCCERIKKDIKGGTKAEPLFLKLFMEALDDDGRCAVIVPDGMLFNDSSLHNETRKMLVEKFNLKKVISLSDDFFLNTGVKTSILFFTREKAKTTEVEFSFIKLKKNDIDETSVIKVQYDELKKNNYTLFSNKYNAKVIDKIKNIEYKKLGEILKSNNGGEVISKEYWNKGDKILYTCCQNYIDTNYDNFPKEKLTKNGDILLPRNGSGTPYAKYPIVGSLYSNVVQRIIVDTDICYPKYIYYAINFDIQQIIDKVNIGTIPSYNFDLWKDFCIPLPSLEIQKQIVKLVELFDNNSQTCKKQLEETKEILKNYIEIQTKNITDEKSCDDLFDMTIGKKTSKDISEDGTYDFYNGSAKAPVGKAVEYSCNNKTPYILIIKDGGAGQGNYGEQIGLGKTFYVSGKTSFTTSVVALINKDEKKMDTKYLYYYLHSQKNNLMDLAQYTTGLGHMGTTKLKNYMIKTPQIEQQKEIVKYCDKLNEITINMEQQIENNEKMMKKVMDEYLKSKNKPTDLINNKKNSDSADDKDSDSDEDKKPNKIIKKKSDNNKKEKIVKKKESESDSDSDNNEAKMPKKIIKKKSDIKNVKKIAKKEDSDSSGYSDSDSDSDDTKTKKKVSKK
jgi:type I restriction-modification system DNA methylase subunit